jgi:amino acid adenylation domain-containing protein
VAVSLTRSANAAIALLAVFKAGGVYLPMDPDYPAERIAFLLDDSQAAVVVTEEGLQDRLPPNRASVILLDAVLNAQSTNNAAGVFAERRGAANLAYVIYTSGSTGTPKGVLISQANVYSYVVALRDALGIAAGDRWLHTASYGFSSSIRQFLLPLSCGASVIVATAAQLQDPRAMFETIQKAGVTIIDLVPSHARTCIHALKGIPDDARHALLRNQLRLILSASETLASDIPRDWAALCGGVTIINMFGQTETTGIVSVYAIPSSISNGAGAVPVGRAIANSRIYLLDAQRNPVPAGVPGEIYVGGGGVGAGYLNLPDRTAERFVADPFNGDVNSRLYRTGDRARCRPDGNIEFLGRNDQQIKVRGFRIEPAETEAVLRQHPMVRECAVVAAEKANGTRLVACIVPEQRPPAAFSSELRQYLKTKLPPYMIPSAFIELDELPRTFNGKVDRLALSATVGSASALAATADNEPLFSKRSAHDLDELDTAVGHVPAVTPSETILAKVWSEVLGVDRVGIHDNFFDLGGDSLLTTHAVQRANDAGLQLRIAQIFEHPTIAMLAQAAGDRPHSGIGRDRAVAAAARKQSAPFRIRLESLRAYGQEALEQAGLPPEGAAIVTEVQLEASLRSQSTHNIGSIPRYARRIASGRTNAKPNFRIERETAISALVDGDNGQGQWVASWAMALAIRKAKESGVGLVGARRSNHLGAAGHYAWLAAEQNLIGLCTTNAGAWLAPTGGLTATFGNNPLAVGIPAGQFSPIIMDISMSVAAKGKIGLHLAQGNPLPMGWIFDRFGRFSTDPSDLAAGLGVPIGGHKGYALNLVLETLAGILTGAGFCREHRRERMRQGPPDLGHFFMAIDPELFMPIAEFTLRVDRMIEQVKASERAEGVPEILLPGEMEMRARAENILEGVPVLPVTYSVLEKHRKTAGLSHGLEFAAAREK